MHNSWCIIIMPRHDKMFHLTKTNKKEKDWNYQTVRDVQTFFIYFFCAFHNHVIHKWKVCYFLSDNLISFSLFCIHCYTIFNYHCGTSKKNSYFCTCVVCIFPFQFPSFLMGNLSSFEYLRSDLYLFFLLFNHKHIVLILELTVVPPLITLDKLSKIFFWLYKASKIYLFY